MDAPMDGHAESNMPLQLFQSWGHKKVQIYMYKTFQYTTINIFLPISFLHMF